MEHTSPRQIPVHIMSLQINITVSVYLQDFDHLYDPGQQKVSLWSGQRDITGFCLLLWGPSQRQSWRPSVQHPPGHLEPCEHHCCLIWCAKQSKDVWNETMPVYICLILYIMFTVQCEILYIMFTVAMWDSVHYVHCGNVRFCTLCSLWQCEILYIMFTVVLWDSVHYVHCGTVRFCTLCSLWYCEILYIMFTVVLWDSVHYVHCGTVRFCTLCSLWYCEILYIMFTVAMWDSVHYVHCGTVIIKAELNRTAEDKRRRC